MIYFIVNKCDSENYRQIAVSSLMGKLFDNIVLEEQQDSLFTDLLQFGFNPIRSGLFQTVNDPGGGALKAPPPHDLENYCVNLHHIIHVNLTRCFRSDPIGIFKKFAILTTLQRF